MFRGSVKSIDYPLHSQISPSLPLPCVTVCHRVSSGLYPLCTLLQLSFGPVVNYCHWHIRVTHTQSVVFFSRGRDITRQKSWNVTGRDGWFGWVVGLANFVFQLHWSKNLFHRADPSAIIYFGSLHRHALLHIAHACPATQNGAYVTSHRSNR